MLKSLHFSNFVAILADFNDICSDQSDFNDIRGYLRRGGVDSRDGARGAYSWRLLKLVNSKALSMLKTGVLKKISLLEC